MISLLIFIIVLGVIIFVHELGHFLVAKRAGMRVDEFGFGFPPRIFGVKRGGTTYSLNWIPLGGFVKIKGENGEGAWDSDSFASKSVVRRMAVILAGVTMNVLLAFVIFTAGFLIGLPLSTDALPAGAIVSGGEIRVGAVLADSPAAAAGMKTGDIIAAIGGQAVAGSANLRSALRASGEEVEMKIVREGHEQAVRVRPKMLPETGSRGIGVELVDTGMVRFPWYLAPIRGAAATVNMLLAIVGSFWNLLVGLVVGRGLTADVSGPVGIAAVTGQAARLGFGYLAEFTALLSLNLAVINAVPFPALDGGRFLFLAIEGLRRRPISRRIEGIVHQVGFAALMALIVAVTGRDLLRYSGAISAFVKGLF